MARRKTVDVRALVEKVNHMNQHSTCSAEHRAGWNSLLESVLYDSNVYAGFGYLDGKDVPLGHKPGIIWGRTKDGAQDAMSNVYPDETRKRYYIHHSLS